MPKGYHQVNVAFSTAEWKVIQKAKHLMEKSLSGEPLTNSKVIRILVRAGLKARGEKLPEDSP